MACAMIGFSHPHTGALKQAELSRRLRIELPLDPSRARTVPA